MPPSGKSNGSLSIIVNKLYINFFLLVVYSFNIINYFSTQTLTPIWYFYRKSDISFDFFVVGRRAFKQKIDI